MQSFYDVILSPFNAPVAGAQVFVYKADGTLATLYDSNVPLSTTVLSSDGTSYYISEDLLSPISNPIVTGADGKYLFFAANGVYSIIIVAAGYDNKTLSIELNDPSVTPFVQTVNIQEFSTVGTSTWTKPVGAKFVEVLMYGGGGGGASGGRVSDATENANGGGGGAAGSRVEIRLPATALNATETVTVGGGGAGGLGRTINNLTGLLGTDGDPSFFKPSVYRADGGQGGRNASTAASSYNSIDAFRTNATSAYIATGALASATSGAVSGARGGFRGGGGGAGGGWAPSNGLDREGAEGGLGGSVFSGSTAFTTGGGGSGGAAGVAGSNGPDAPAGYYVGGSGGGGGGQSASAAGAGGAGGYPGGGGGGGAASRGAFDSGAGGDGGDGYIRVVTYL